LEYDRASFEASLRSAPQDDEGFFDAVHNSSYPGEAPPGPRFARPEDKLRAVSQDAMRADAALGTKVRRRALWYDPPSRSGGL